MILDVIKVFIPALISFVFGIAMTPLLTHYLYARQMWKKIAGKIGLDGKVAAHFNRLHETREVGVPRLGGIVIWLSAALSIGGIYFLAQVSGEPLFTRLDFLSRSQTWIPLTALLLGAFIGLADDLAEIRGNGEVRGGLRLRTRLYIVALAGLLCGLWFYFKLGVFSIGIPFWGELYTGWLIVPLFTLVALGVYSGGIIDGIDGLAGGIFAIVFGAYSAIAFFQSQINLAAFCAALLGGILAFLWFNIPPARFYMSETGSMALTLALAVVAFMTDALGEGRGLVVLPIVAFPLLVTSASVIIQTLAKKLLRRKIFRIAPLHHHFEALGWPPSKVTMRYWVFGVMTAIAGVIVALVG